MLVGTRTRSVAVLVAVFAATTFSVAGAASAQTVTPPITITTTPPITTTTTPPISTSLPTSLPIPTSLPGAPASPSGGNTGFVPATDFFNCSDFANQEDAQAVLLADPSDPNRLDGDGDGRACDNNPSNSSVSVPAYTGFPSGGVATGDGSTEGLNLGQIALMIMVGFTALSGATKLVLVARGGKVA